MTTSQTQKSELNHREYRLGNLFRDKKSGLYLGLIDLSKEEIGFIPLGQPKIGITEHREDPAAGYYTVEPFIASDFDTQPLPVGWQADRIPLTDQFLERFLFQATGKKTGSYYLTESFITNTNHRIPLFTIELYQLTGGGWIYCAGKFDRVFYFVDELQNFFHSITQVELPNSEF